MIQADEDREQRRLKKLEAQKIRQQKIAEEVCTVIMNTISVYMISEHSDVILTMMTKARVLVEVHL